MKSSLIKPKTLQSNKLNYVTHLQSPSQDLGIAFALLPLKADQVYEMEVPLETAVVLMTGQVLFECQGKTFEGQRQNLFEQDPFVLHVPASTPFKIRAATDCELSLLQVENHERFEPMIFDRDNMLESEDRGLGLLNNTSYRIVRTVFDKRNRPASNLVVGEVITFPGGWSSYPPHHHPQPEIYHYRFTEPQGFGFAQCGQDVVYKACHGDTLLIEHEASHAQVSAPGYGMYYLWFIRHLPNNPYYMPSFTQEHEWTRTQEANQRVWQGMKQVKKG